MGLQRNLAYLLAEDDDDVLGAGPVGGLAVHAPRDKVSNCNGTLIWYPATREGFKMGHILTYVCAANGKTQCQQCAVAWVAPAVLVCRGAITQQQCKLDSTVFRKAGAAA